MLALSVKKGHSALRARRRLPIHPRRCLFLLCTLCLLLLLIEPESVMEAVREALHLCAETIVPSLFPFFVFSALLTSLAPMERIERWCAPLMRPLFHLSGNCAAVLVLGFTGGYPVGVRTAAALYHENYLSRGETSRLLAFCNNSGPGFLVGVVGVGVFGSAAVGLKLYAVHIISALIVGFLFRFYRTSPTRSSITDVAAPRREPSPSLPRLFIEAVTGSMMSVLNICAFVLFFMILLRLLSLTGILHLLASATTALFAPLGMTEYLATALIAGFLELSTGALCMQGMALTAGTAALASFLLGWGGVSVHCQSLLFLMEAELGCKTYLVGKLLQGVLSAVLTYLLFLL